MKRLIIIAVVGLALFAGETGCKTKSSRMRNAAVADQNVTDSIKAKNEQFMSGFQKEDTTRFAQVYTKDGWIIPPNSPPIKGRGQIKKFLIQTKNMGLSKIQLNSNEVFVDSDSTAVETGTYKLFVGNGQPTDQGSYMVYWKKEGGSWRMFRDIWNSDMSPTDQQGTNKVQ
ncbi:MAG TPA: SgcJ/EcaC family oxidoreductase [Balneolaceae bacterium]|nr:SgcJ/EcaC family oxidoreductase [Balneolaceae bacterium]